MVTLYSTNWVADQRFSLKQWFAGGAQSRGLRTPGCGHPTEPSIRGVAINKQQHRHRTLKRNFQGENSDNGRFKAQETGSCLDEAMETRKTSSIS